MTTYTLTEIQIQSLLKKLERYQRKRQDFETFAEDIVFLINLQPNTQEPVDRQFQSPDGRWHNFLHYANTVADGNWPIRELFTHPEPQAKPLTEALDELENCMDLLNLSFPTAPVDSCIGVAIIKARAVLKAHGVKP